MLNHRAVRLCCMIAVSSLADCKLLSVITITRHGNRAPNPAVQSVCPAIAGDAKKIEHDFGVGPGFLTGQGYEQIKRVGEFLREYYLEGPTPRLELPQGESDAERAQHFHFQTPSNQRHMRSAGALAEGMLPGIKHSILSLHPADDNLVAAPPHACTALSNELALDWMRRVGVTGFYADTKPAVQTLEKICKRKFVEADYNLEDTTVGNPHPPFQDVVDLLDFRAGDGLPEPKGWAEVRYEARKLAFEGIMDRTFKTDMQKVFWLGALPEHIIARFTEASLPLPPGILMTNYVTSRELHYAFTRYFNFKFNMTEQDMPLGAIVPGTTILIELHGDDHVRPGHSTRHNKKIRVGYYSPSGKPSGERPYDASFKWVKLPGCDDEFCSWGQFMEIIVLRQRHAGGGFAALCSALNPLPSAVAASAAMAMAASSDVNTGGHIGPVCVFLSIAMVAAMVAAVLSRVLYRRGRGQGRIESTEYKPLGENA